MPAENKNDSALADRFEAAKKLDTPLDTGAAAERGALKKEAARLIKEGQKFEKSKAEWRKKLMKAALVVAGASVALNLVLGVALAAMAPLKTVEPYVLEVNKTTGEVNVRQPLKEKEVLPSYGEETDKHYLEQYTIARESYDWGLAQRNYETVKAFSVLNASLWNEYNTFIKSDKSPVKVLADKARVIVEVSSIPLDVKTGTATVRFSKQVLAADGLPSTTIPKTYWIATVKYSYPNPKLTPAERRLNPPGMKVSSFRPVQELGGR